MDLNRLRSKRLRLFDSKAKHEQQSSSSSSSSTTKPSISDDERFARELQAQIEAEERPAHSQPADHLDEDARLARELHTPMGTGAFPPGDSDAAYFDPFEQLLGMPPAHCSHNGVHQPGPWTSVDNSGPTNHYSTDSPWPSPVQATAPADPLFAGRRMKDAPPAKHASPGLAPVEAYNVDNSHDALHVRSYANVVSRASCRNCPSARGLARDNLIKFFDSIISGSGPNFPTEFVFRCTSCNSKLCLGCSVTLSKDAVLGVGTTASNGRCFTWHCDAARLAFVWCLLCGYDNNAKHNKSVTKVQHKSKLSKIHTLANTMGMAGGGSASKGVGYGDDHGHDGYSEDEFEDEVASTFHGAGVTLDGRVVTPPKTAEPKSAADPDDELTMTVMAVLAAILPTPWGTTPSLFDYQPHAVLRSMFLRSSLLDKVAELLRNDSLEDATSRYALYDGLFNFIRVLAQGSYLTAGVLHEERLVNKAGHDLCKVSYNLRTLLKVDHTDTAAPVAHVIRNLTSQSNMMMRNCAANPHLFDSEDGQQLLRLCTNIVNCAEILQTSVPRSFGKARAKEPEVDQDAWQKDLAVMDVSDTDILAVHYSSKDASDCKNVKPGRMRQLVKEVTNLQTSLPPGIFVRYGESRLDVMKVLIVGPKGTPYQNGLFEFDLFCPADYPNVPPKMYLKTTGGGRHRFNPNLYQDGKVCLSLLNTWSGQRWTPGQSTILQVLVSIQAMVFCDEPHCNEPGYENQAGSDLSKQYNRNQYPAVIKYAMLEWLDGERKVTPTRATYDYGIVDAHAAIVAAEAFKNGVPPPPSSQEVPPGPKNYTAAYNGPNSHYVTSNHDAATQPAHPMPFTAAPASFMPSNPPQAYSWTPIPQPQNMLPPPPPFPGTQFPSNSSYATNDLSNPSQPTFTNPWATSPATQKPPPLQLPYGVVPGSFKPVSTYKPAPKSIPLPPGYPTANFTPTPYLPPAPPRPRAQAASVVDNSSIWDAVINKHFEVKHEEILETVCGWVNDREPLKNLHRHRGKGRRLGSEPEPETSKPTFTKVEELRKKGQDLKGQLREALKELPDRRGSGSLGWEGW